MDSENIYSTKQLLLLCTRENQIVIFIVHIFIINTHKKTNETKAKCTN